MKVRVRNLGVISEGTLDLTKRVNILCGANGTGKTYFSYIVYALFSRPVSCDGLDSEFVDDLFSARSLDLDIPWADVESYSAMLFKTTSHDLERIYGIGSADALRVLGKVLVERAESADEMRARLTQDRVYPISILFGNTRIRISKDPGAERVHLSLMQHDPSTQKLTELKQILPSVVCHFLAVHPVRQAMMFPVERSSIYTFSKELSLRRQGMLDQLQVVADKGKDVDTARLLNNRYPLPVTDSLRQAEDLAHIRSLRGTMYGFAECLEHELLGGSVGISEQGEIEYVPDKASTLSLPIKMSASLVKTLSSLVVYLKHQAQRSDLIIIDEPEINLHPQNQVTLARIFARLANKGFRLLISTHSDYILREINNLVMMSHKDNASVVRARKKYGYTDDEYLRAEDLAVSVFGYKNRNSRKVGITPVEVDDYGAEMKSIDEVIMRQNEASRELYYGLKYGQQK